MAVLRDVTLEIDDFSKNKIISGIEAEAQQFYILLNMEPGDCADDPDKGINMRQYRVGLSDTVAGELKSAIEKQVELYCDFQISDIEVIYKDGELVVGIQLPTSTDIILFTTTADNILSTIITS